jgi:hypothetical protein
MDIINSLDRVQFRMLHGWALTAAWHILPALAVLAKPFNLYLHALLFWVANLVGLGTLWLGIMRKDGLMAMVTDLQARPMINQGHVYFGAFMAVLMTLNHFGGIATLLGGGSNPQHRKFGWAISCLVRVPVSVGWYLVGQLELAVCLLILAVVLGYQTMPRLAKGSKGTD